MTGNLVSAPELISSFLRRWKNVMLKTLTIAILALGATIIPAVSLADADGPDFFRVIGVASNDALNIRETANAHARKIGAISPNVGGVRNLGCENGLTYAEWEKATEAERKAAAKRRWCKIDYQGTVGWVSGRYLAEDAMPDDAIEEPGFAWRLVSIDETNALGEGEIVFMPDGSIFGSTGCNSFNGSVLLGGDKITFQTPLATTRMACPGDLGIQEQAFLKALSSEVRFSYDPIIDQITFVPADSASVLRFQRLR